MSAFTPGRGALHDTTRYPKLSGASSSNSSGPQLQQQPLYQPLE